jgi:hypothetical protein
LDLNWLWERTEDAADLSNAKLRVGMKVRRTAPPLQGITGTVTGWKRDRMTFCGLIVQVTYERGGKHWFPADQLEEVQ